MPPLSGMEVINILFDQKHITWLVVVLVRVTITIGFALSMTPGTRAKVLPSPALQRAPQRAFPLRP